MRDLTTRGFTPVFVFLDSSGKKIAETAGFRNPKEARALHEFISKRHYLKMNWQDFAARAEGR